MKETDVLQSTAPDDTWSIFKVVLLVIPPLLVSKVFPHGHWVLFGASFIAGTLLQAILPPRTYRLWRMLGIATAVAIVIPVIAHFAGRN